MGLQSKQPDGSTTHQPIHDLSYDDRVIACIKDVDSRVLGKATHEICAYFGSLKFQEVVLSPFTAYPMDYKDEVVDVPDLGQLRYNTEPEIWEKCRPGERFFSTSTLFRKEKTFNPLRRPAFSIVDFYQPGPPASMKELFVGLVEHLAHAGIITTLHQLPFSEGVYDPISGGPLLHSLEPRWVLAGGYDAASSFFEINEEGQSTRSELFLVTKCGFLEVAAIGIVGWNRNPNYTFRHGADNLPPPSPYLSGMGFGLERLLLAEQVLAVTGKGTL